jgi:hypothetical protein
MIDAPPDTRFEGLVTVGEWIDFVTVLGRVLARDTNSHQVSELANSGCPKKIAYGIGSFMQATSEQIAEAKSLVNKPLTEVKDHFMPRRRQ